LELLPCLSSREPLARQGTQAAAGLQLSAQQAGVRLTVVDDGGLRSTELRGLLRLAPPWYGLLILRCGLHGAK
jgi:hypothetical protein